MRGRRSACNAVGGVWYTLRVLMVQCASSLAVLHPIWGRAARKPRPTACSIGGQLAYRALI